MQCKSSLICKKKSNFSKKFVQEEFVWEEIFSQQVYAYLWSNFVIRYSNNHNQPSVTTT